MRRRGRPILGAFAGFFSGLFLATTLLLYGVVSLDSLVLIALPVAGLVVVTVLAWWCPWGGRTTPVRARAADDAIGVEAGDATEPPAAEAPVGPDDRTDDDPASDSPS